MQITVVKKEIEKETKKKENYILFWLHGLRTFNVFQCITNNTWKCSLFSSSHNRKISNLRFFGGQYKIHSRLLSQNQQVKSKRIDHNQFPTKDLEHFYMQTLKRTTKHGCFSNFFSMFFQRVSMNLSEFFLWFDWKLFDEKVPITEHPSECNVFAVWKLHFIICIICI